MRALTLHVITCSLVALPALGQSGDKKGEQQPELPADLEVPAAPVLTPEEELAQFILPPGFSIQLVASEPMTVDPVLMVFDEQARLWVVEMRGYMPDMVGTGEKEPISRIAILTDTDGDGVMDERQEFGGGLVLPRGVAPMYGGALCLLPPDLVFLRDEDGDGEFETREVVVTGLTGGLQNPEHAINSPVIGLDNWVHFANWNKSVRRVVDEDGNGTWLIRAERGQGQWGLAQDDVGRFVRNTNPNPMFFDVAPSHYAVRNRHQRRFHGAFVGVHATKEVFPSRINPGVNRGYQKVTLRDDFTLFRYTGACSATPLRGYGLGEDAYGDVYVCEPTGNLVKRYYIVESEVSPGLVAHDVRHEFDFLTSKHERFRPVALTTGPDGALYIADMYRGLIQHRIYLTSFLRKQIEDRGLVGPMGLGRIWRVRKDDADVTRPAVDMLEASLLELVAMLGSDNAWMRESAQRMLVEDVDGEATVLAALRLMTCNGDRPLGAVHALWTLEGVGYADETTLAAAIGASDPRVRAAALQIAEALLDVEGCEIRSAVASAAVLDTDARARLFALLSLGASDSSQVLETYMLRLMVDATCPFERSAMVSGLEFREAAFILLLSLGDPVFHRRDGLPKLLQELAACVGREGLQENIERIVALALDPPAEWWSKPLLDGLLETRRKGPKGERLPISMRAKPAAVEGVDVDPESSFAKLLGRIDKGFTWPGKPGAKPVELPRELTEGEWAQYRHGQTVFELVCATCHQHHGGGQDAKAPTLRGTPWVVGDEGRLASILLHGLEGPLEIDGQTWNMEMPRFEGTDDDLAAVLTYIRRSWGNGVEPVTVEAIEAARAAADGRTKPLHADEIR